MRHPTICLLLSLPLLGPGLAAPAGAKAERPPPDAPPQLISIQGGRAKWRNTRELQAGAAEGDPRACFELGTRLLDGDEELTADPVAARALLETAAKGGMADAHFRLGKMHHDGRGVARDYGKALEHYTAAARHGVSEAQHNLGAMLVSARGVKRDFVEGLAWLLVAQEGGATSDALQKVRERLAQRPADLRAAELRAKEILADLANAVVRMEPRPARAPAAPTPPTTLMPAPKVDVPAMQPTLTLPNMEPLAPPRVTVPPASPPAAPR